MTRASWVEVGCEAVRGGNGQEASLSLGPAGLAIRQDFDKIALLSPAGWDHNSHYHAFLLRHLPPRLESALDIGCGTGDFTRRLAQRSGQVLGLDISPEMIRVARERSGGCDNVRYQVADVMDWDVSAGVYDCVASIATLHHLPLKGVLQRMVPALKPGGSLLALDLYRAEGIWDLLFALPGLPASIALRILKIGRFREPHELRAAWSQHALNDHYLTLLQVRGTCKAILPGARVRRHLLWRYSITWKKDTPGRQS